MREAPVVVEFRPDNTDEIVAAMAELTVAQKGWITLQPAIREEDTPPPRSVFGALFSGTGPPVPVCTWVAPEPRQKPPHAELGILHQTGPKASKRLAAGGIEIPDHWVVLADHPRRGLVIALHPETAPNDALDWLLRAGEALTRIPLTGTWKASIYGRT